MFCFRYAKIFLFLYSISQFALLKINTYFITLLLLLIALYMVSFPFTVLYFLYFPNFNLHHYRDKWIVLITSVLNKMTYHALRVFWLDSAQIGGAVSYLTPPLDFWFCSKG